MDPDFPSKRDGWIVAVIWSSIFVQLLATRLMFSAPGPLAFRIAFVAILVAPAAFMLWVTYGTGYTVSATEIHARCGPFHYRIPLATLATITPSNDIRSSPAVSLDRLRVAWRDASGRERELLISPADQAGFLAAVATRCPSLGPAGDGLVARA